MADLHNAESQSAPAPADVIELFSRTNRTIAVAESLTGGLLCGRLTSAPGASVVVVGGVVTYATRAKRDVLGVSPETLTLHGAVSAETAAEMATRVRALFGSSIGIATTGVAGPDMQEGKDVGTVFIGIASADRTHVEQLHLQGTREVIRTLAVARALELLAREI